MSNQTKEALAYALAKDAHEGQKYGKHDYFQYHVLGVASKFSRRCDAPYQHNDTCVKCGTELERNYSNPDCRSYDHEAYMAALLHDVVEDSEVSGTTIVDLFGIEIGSAILQLSKFDDTDYEDYIRSIQSHIAIRVKIADLKFHLSQPKLKNESKYRKALAYLEAS